MKTGGDKITSNPHCRNAAKFLPPKTLLLVIIFNF